MLLYHVSIDELRVQYATDKTSETSFTIYSTSPQHEDAGLRGKGTKKNKTSKEKHQKNDKKQRK